jgi:L-ascorbate metabolism protein UlaG (beta-lactamase superfamily)
MTRISLLAIFLVGCMVGPALAEEQFEKDTLKTSAGDLEMIFVGHGTLIFVFGGKVIHIDPYSKVADYAKLPQADLILITHDHRDHLDLVALNQVRTEKTVLISPASCTTQLNGGTVMNNGEVRTIGNLKIEAVPAYNIVHKRENGEPYHPKGLGNGYVLTFGDKRIYVAGDTENIPEMKSLQAIDVAFLPMNLPYTMTPEMVADAATAFKPKILYPYHFGDTDTSQIVVLLKDAQGIEVRIRRLQ